MTNASRAPIDFDAFERELAQPSSAQPEARSAPEQAATHKADPLAELARIVGQDDPFRALLAAREGQAPAKPGADGRREPTFLDAPTARDPQPEPSPADAFDQYLASVEQGEYGQHDHPPHDPAAFAASDEPRPVPAERPRGRGRLVQVGAGLGVLVLCVTGALTWRGLHGGAGNGEPVTVLADKTPLKVAPTAADGVEIPDQNKQIYDRTAKDGQIKVVNREEQPLDVAQAARAAQARDAETPGAAGQGGATPQPGLLTDSLGEPRRVRTVSVKPDTPPAPQREAAAEPVAPAIPPVPVLTMPEPAPTATPTQAPARPSRALASAASPASTPVQAAAAPSRTQPAPAETPALKAPQRVASVAPETTASTLEAPAATKASAASVGGFSVQLGVRTSEGDARAAFRQMQGKFSQLAGKPELIVPAEVNGKSLYRVRVGPLAKAEASSLCSALQGAGGQCFVAKN